MPKLPFESSRIYRTRDPNRFSGRPSSWDDPQTPVLDAHSGSKVHSARENPHQISCIVRYRSKTSYYSYRAPNLMRDQSHICVLQTALDLLELGYHVHIIADGVSSCNREEVPFALERMRQAGAQITTSESAAFQLQRKSPKEFLPPLTNKPVPMIDSY